MLISVFTYRTIPILAGKDLNNHTKIYQMLLINA